MAQKIIKIGKSVGITLPKDILRELDVTHGDSVVLEVDKKRKGVLVRSVKKNLKVKQELMDWTDNFIEKYRPALKELAKK